LQKTKKNNSLRRTTGTIRNGQQGTSAGVPVLDGPPSRCPTAPRGPCRGGHRASTSHGPSTFADRPLRAWRPSSIIKRIASGPPIGRCCESTSELPSGAKGFGTAHDVGKPNMLSRYPAVRIPGGSYSSLLHGDGPPTRPQEAGSVKFQGGRHPICRHNLVGPF